MERHKYPRTFHLPWSPGRGSDDRVHDSVSFFDGLEVAVSYKLDGECTAIYWDGFTHARSTAGNPHPSRDWLKARAAEFAYRIPTGYRVYGENCTARHSIALAGLPSYFLVFAVVTDENEWLSLKDTLEFCSELGLEHVPIAFQGFGTRKRFASVS